MLNALNDRNEKKGDRAVKSFSPSRSHDWLPTFPQENTMSTPVIADVKPVVLELEPGTYYWCSCGQSSNQPFCNGAHKGTDFTPLAFQIDEKKSVALCNCKHTGNAPFCDGSHTKLNPTS